MASTSKSLAQILSRDSSCIEVKVDDWVNIQLCVGALFCAGCVIDAMSGATGIDNLVMKNSLLSPPEETSRLDRPLPSRTALALLILRQTRHRQCFGRSVPTQPVEWSRSIGRRLASSCSASLLTHACSVGPPSLFVLRDSFGDDLLLRCPSGRDPSRARSSD